MSVSDFHQLVEMSKWKLYQSWFIRGQNYSRVAFHEYQRRDGSVSVLVELQSQCAKCGEPFRVKAPASVEPRQLSLNRRCPKHHRPGVKVR